MSYVYGYYYPETAILAYIGKGKDDRMIIHLSPSKGIIMEHNISLRDDLNDRSVALDCRSIAIVVPYGAPDKIEWMKDCRLYWQTSHKALTDVEIKKWLPEYKNEYEQWGVYSPMWVSHGLKTPVVKKLGNIIIARYNSVREAARHQGISHTSITLSCQGKRNSVYGYKWEYA